jgi:hypothetical protein
LLAAPAHALQEAQSPRVGLVTQLGAVVPFKANELGVHFGAGARFVLGELSCDGSQYVAPALALLATGTWSTSLIWNEPRGGYLSGLAARFELLVAQHEKVLLPWFVGWLTAGGGLGPDSQRVVRGAGWAGIGASFNLWSAPDSVKAVAVFVGLVLIVAAAVAAIAAGVAVGGPSGGPPGALFAAGVAFIGELVGLVALTVVNVEVRYAVRQVAGGAQGYGMIVLGVGL